MTETNAVRSFRARVEHSGNGGIAIRVPFNPSAVWGERDVHHVAGSIAGQPVRGTLTVVDEGHKLRLGPAWCRGATIASGTEVDVTLMPEGPQLSSLAADVRAALDEEPEASRFFTWLATFYRSGYVRWIEQAKRPETRVRRIAETVAALKAGRKQR